MKRTILAVLPCAVLILAVSGCQSVPDPAKIPTSLTIAELSQKGQNELDDYNYQAAEVYYGLIIQRYGTDLGALTAAEYEIAHIRIKQKKWADAKTLLDGILARYEVSGGAGLPPEFLKLAKIDLEKIPAPKKAAGAAAEPAPAEAPAPAETTAPAAAPAATAPAAPATPANQ